MTIQEVQAKIRLAEEEIRQIILALPLSVQGINFETDGKEISISLDVRL